MGRPAYTHVLMALISGTRLGPYEITGLLGSGGMGEVYRARDTRLDRTVAVKIMATWGADADQRQRFEREARAIASLSHPNICALHDVGSVSATESGPPLEYLVMEYLDGETLAQRLEKGPLPLDEIIRIGADIACALEAAHRLRIVHRDLKPANVMLSRGGVKLLDFGLARAFGRETVPGPASMTLTGAVTAAGTVIGTLPYMAPEQVEGREADARSDIFAFGAVLYEMAAGRRPFAGATSVSLASAILSAAPAPLPISLSLDRIVRTCLEKDPDRRWQSAQDVALQLREVIATDRTLATRSSPPATRSALPWTVALIAGAIAIAASALAWRGRAAAAADQDSPSPPVRFTVPLADKGYLSLSVERPALAISPDGRYIAYVGGVGDSGPSVWLRPLSSEAAAIVPGTEDASSVFWSPDAKAIAFFAGGQLKRVAIAGGAPVKICDVRQGIGQTGTWGDGEILFASVQGEQILRVSADGGSPVTLFDRDPKKNEDRVTWPSFLPDGRRFLYLAGRSGDAGTIMLGSLDGPARELLPIRSNAQYVEPGFIVYGQDGALLARRFDAATGTTSGEPVAIAERANQFLGTGLAQFSASRNGAIVVHSGEDQARIVVFDRVGGEVSVLRQPASYEELRLSADGHDIYVDRREPRTGAMDIWRIEMKRGGLESRVTSDPGTELQAVIARDGSMIFSSTRGGPPRLYRRPLAGPDEPLAEHAPDGMQVAPDLSPDGKWVIYQQRGQGKFDLVAVSLADLRAVPFHPSDADEFGGRFSPDGSHVAYVSDLGGRREIYVAAFPGPGPARIVSSAGGIMPRWSADGSELFYMGSNGALFSVPMRTTPTLEIGVGRQLFVRGPRARWNSFEPTPDGRFVAVEPVQFGAEQPLHIFLNWPALAFGGR
ncbi:MAG: protein kinase [Vicinamibacterales bacterium]